MWSFQDFIDTILGIVFRNPDIVQDPLTCGSIFTPI